jgi:hypothetical protein
MENFNQELTLRPKEREDGSWYVEATWKNAPPQIIGNFKSESEAQDWIIYKSGAHFDSQDTR